MRFATFNDDRVGIIDGDRIRDVTDHLPPAAKHSRMRQLIELWPEFEVPKEAPTLQLSNVSLQAPITDPTKIIAAPVNYRDHQAEMTTDTQVSGLGFFLKAPSSIVGTGATVFLPYSDRRFDHEGELAVVVGKSVRNISEDEALGAIFGYTSLLDLTMRGGEDRSIRKSFETFTPMGPWITTADEFGSPTSAELRCWVNSELRQEATTADLIWGVARFLSYASSVTTLEPGDILATGTPAGVGPIADGDTVRVEVSGIGGPLEVVVSSTGATLSPTTGKGKGPVPPPPPSRRSGSTL